jgi:hypothetical protein
MAKANPLFVDSTKLHGDCIGTQFELNNVLIYDDETLAVFVTNHLGKTVRMPMKHSDTGTFEARVMLSHQKPVTYQFVIEKNGQAIFQSTAVQARAQYAIIEDWQPVETTEPLPVTVETGATPPPTRAPDRELNMAADYALTIKALIEKWDL